jgi:hypothetical protein
MKTELRALPDAHAADRPRPLHRLPPTVGVPPTLLHTLAPLDGARLDLSGGAGAPHGPSLGPLGPLGRCAQPAAPGAVLA